MHKLLDKLQPDMISLDPNMFGIMDKESKVGVCLAVICCSFAFLTFRLCMRESVTLLGMRSICWLFSSISCCSACHSVLLCLFLPFVSLNPTSPMLLQKLFEGDRKAVRDAKEAEERKKALGKNKARGKKKSSKRCVVCFLFVRDLSVFVADSCVFRWMRKQINIIDQKYMEKKEKIQKMEAEK